MPGYPGGCKLNDMTNVNEIKVGDMVLVSAPKSGTGPDGYEGEMYVHEIQGYEFGLARNPYADGPAVWIHAQRVSVA